MEPLVSILMPAYNAEKYIKSSIRSILNQSYKHFELIIVDDGSEDNTSGIIKSFSDKRIIYVKNQTNLKLPKSLNKAMKLANGKYIARSDADDINMPGRFENQVNFLELNPSVDAVGTNMYVYNDTGKIIGGIYNPYTKHEDLIFNIPWRAPLAHATIMARSEWFKRYKYCEKYYRAEDLDLFLRSYRKSKFANLKEYYYAIREPEINLKKLTISNWHNIIMVINNMREYKLPIRRLLVYPFMLGGRFIYYGLASALRKGLMWGHLKTVVSSDELGSAQGWIFLCLKN